MWGYGFRAAGGGTRRARLAGARELEAADVVVTTAADSGPGRCGRSWRICRRAAAFASPRSRRTDDRPHLRAAVLSKDVTIEASDAPGVVLSGNGADRVSYRRCRDDGSLRGLTVADRFGFDLAGGILNKGSLTLHRASSAQPAWCVHERVLEGRRGDLQRRRQQLVLRQSTAAATHHPAWTGAASYAFLGATVTVQDSTIEGNSAGNVGGGIRKLGNVTSPTPR